MIELFPEPYYILGVEVATSCSQSIKCTQSISIKNCKVVYFQKCKCSPFMTVNFVTGEDHELWPWWKRALLEFFKIILVLLVFIEPNPVTDNSEPDCGWEWRSSHEWKVAGNRARQTVQMKNITCQNTNY